MNTKLPDLWTPQDVALWLNLRTRDVLRMTRGGELPCIALPNGEARYDPAELEGWLRRRRDETNNDRPGSV